VRCHRILLVPAIMLLICADGTAGQRRQEPVIERIDIQGNQRVPETRIRSDIQSKPGDPYEETRLDSDLRSLYQSNLFENISIEARDGDSGEVVTFILKERPIIREIAIRGNKSLTASEIIDAIQKKKAGFAPVSVYDSSKIRAAERLLKNLMIQRGNSLGTVRTEVEELSPPEVRVHFVFDEGPQFSIGKILFEGNRAFSEMELRDALKLNKEHRPGTSLDNTNIYVKEKLEYDIEMNLKGFYRERGYMQVQIGEPRISIFEAPQDVFPPMRYSTEIPVDEGDQYRLGKLELQNCGSMDCAELLRIFGLNKGDIVNDRRIRDAIARIKAMYVQLGFKSFSYVPVLNVDPLSRTYDITIDLKPGEHTP
jgi:outer membrane protein insertion porin family